MTADEVPDPHALALRSYVNGALRQRNDTSGMIHNLWQQIAYLSTAFTLEPGDLIATGTPEGVGVGMDPPRFPAAGRRGPLRDRRHRRDRKPCRRPSGLRRQDMAVLNALSVTSEVPDVEPGVKFYTDAGLIALIEGDVVRFSLT